MKRAFIIVSACLAFAGGDAKEDAKKEQKKLEGKWQVTYVEADGNKQGEEDVKKMTMTFEGDKYTLKMDENIVSKGKTKIDPTKKPKTIDGTPEEGDAIGQVIAAIYEIDGDNLKLCYGQPGQNRPDKFEAGAGTGFTMLKATRVKNQDK